MDDVEPFEPGALVWHRRRRQAGAFLAVDDGDTRWGVVDFGQGDEHRVGLSQLEHVMCPCEARSWADDFAAMRRTGVRTKPWGDHPDSRYQMAVAHQAARYGFKTTWISPAGSSDWMLVCADREEPAAAAD